MNTSNLGAMILETSCNGTLSASVGSPSTAAWKAATICSRISCGVGLVPAIELAEGFFRVGAEKPRNRSTEYRSKYKQWQIYDICVYICIYTYTDIQYNLMYIYIYTVYIFIYIHTHTHTHTHASSHVHRLTNSYNNKIRSCIQVLSPSSSPSPQNYTTLVVQNVQQNSSLKILYLLGPSEIRCN